MKWVSNTIQKMDLPTSNRGVQTFIITKNEKGFYAYELGEATDWGKVTGSGERKARQVNKDRCFRNQYGRWFRPIPYVSIQEATTAIQQRALTSIQYG